MAETRLADLVIPETFDPYVDLLSAKTSRLFQSGAVVADSGISAKLSQGSRVFHSPHLQDVPQTPSNVSDDDPTNTSVPEKIVAGEEIQVAKRRNKHYKTMRLAGTEAGTSISAALARRVGPYWGREYDDIMFHMLAGVAAHNAASDGSDFFVTLDSASTVLLNDSATVVPDAGLLTRQNFPLVHMSMNDRMDLLLNNSILCVHPRQWGSLARDVATEGGQVKDVNVIDIGFGTFMGATIVVSSKCPVDAGASVGGLDVFTAYLLPPGFFRFGTGAGPDLKTLGLDEQEDQGSGGGAWNIHTRRDFCFHPTGHAWVGPTQGRPANDAAHLAAQNTANSGGTQIVANNHLEYAANYNRAFPEREQVPLIVIRSTGAA